MIDLHCHVLPGIDDGPDGMGETLALAGVAVANGIETIVATPHVSWGYPGNDAALISAKVTEVNAALDHAGIPLEVLPGGEIALTRAVDLDDEELSALRLGGGPYLLVECPLTPSAEGFETGVWHLLGRGHRILLAHPERSPGLRRDPDLLRRLAGAGMLTQVTAGAFVGRFGKEVQRFARELLEDGLVNNVASDAHSAHRRPPSIAAELEEAALGGHARLLAAEVPRAILAGAPVPDPPRVPARRRGFPRLRR